MVDFRQEYNDFIKSMVEAEQGLVFRKRNKLLGFKNGVANKVISMTPEEWEARGE